MITESMMYWITRLDGIQGAFGAGVAISITLVGFCWFLYFMSKYVDEKEFKGLRKAGWGSMIATLVCVVGFVLTPTSKEMAMIYTVPAITRSDFVQKDLPELYDLGVQALKEKLTTKD